MPISSMSGVQEAVRMAGETPAAEVVWVQGHLDGQSSIPPAEVARTKRWKHGKRGRNKAQLTQTAGDILDVAELVEPLSYSLKTLGNGQEMWVPVGRDPQDYADEVAQKLGIVITPPSTAEQHRTERPAKQEASKASDVDRAPMQPVAPTTPRTSPACNIRETHHGDAPASTAAPMASEAEVSTAEQAGKDALEMVTEKLFPLVERAATLRMTRLLNAAADERPRIYLRGVRSSLIRFLPEDKMAAMDKYSWYRCQVQRRKCPGYRLEDEGVWMIVQESDDGWECYLQLAPSVDADGGATSEYTLHSKFGTMYGRGDRKLVFESFDHFVDEFSGPADLDAWVEAQVSDDEDDSGDEDEEDKDEEDDDEEDDGEEEDGEEDSVEEMLLWVAWRHELHRARDRRHPTVSDSDSEE